jgi:hypothetical protein
MKYEPTSEPTQGSVVVVVDVVAGVFVVVDVVRGVIVVVVVGRYVIVVLVVDVVVVVVGGGQIASCPNFMHARTTMFLQRSTLCLLKRGAHCSSNVYVHAAVHAGLELRERVSPMEGHMSAPSAATAKKNFVIVNILTQLVASHVPQHVSGKCEGYPACRGAVPYPVSRGYGTKAAGNLSRMARRLAGLHPRLERVAVHSRSVGDHGMAGARCDRARGSAPKSWHPGALVPPGIGRAAG